ncbi:MAG: TetR/AcrR family transcriptional regulator, partial [Actinobacteria bacterium]|nr:TetR/AcrR family transcriptional regulator [Actinomycetota bacterium]
MAGAVERLTTQDYVREALVVLGEEGPEALTIAGLCERLGVTKGSFYHHFGGLPGFVDVLLESWEREEGRRLAAAVRAYPDPGERLAALVE